VATLIVRRVDERLVASLKARARRHGRSAEAEHRAILVAALGGLPECSFAAVLAAMPNVGVDEYVECSPTSGGLAGTQAARASASPHAAALDQAHWKL